MRADRLVRALGRRHRVHLRVVPIHERRPASPSHGGREYDGPCASHERIWRTPGPLQRLRHRHDPERARIGPALGTMLVDSMRGVDPAAIVAFRHYLAPLAFTLRAARGTARVIIDLDELESHTRSRIASLHQRRGNLQAARSMQRQAASYRDRECRELPGADQIWVSSPREAALLAGSHKLDARVVPNAVECPDPSARPKTAAPRGARTLLFIGNLSYLPNVDAVEWLSREILPELSSREKSPTECRVVGAGAPRRLRRELASQPRLELVGYSDTLPLEYQRADVCVVPIRAGGGTRIKLLEALAQTRPVVTTSLGAEGIDLDHERHLLIADDTSSFVDACQTLLNDADRAERLAETGHRRVAESYGVPTLERAVDAALASFDFARGGP